MIVLLVIVAVFALDVLLPDAEPSPEDELRWYHRIEVRG